MGDYEGAFILDFVSVNVWSWQIKLGYGCGSWQQVSVDSKWETVFYGSMWVNQILYRSIGSAER